MEIEENRGLIDKKAPEDQLASLVSSVLVELSSILSLSHSLGHLEFSWSTLGGVCYTWSFGARRQRKSRKE